LRRVLDIGLKKVGIILQSTCHHCGHNFTIDEAAFGSEERLDLPCPSCKKPTPVPNPKLVTFVVDPTRKKVPRVVSQVSPEGRLLLIPANIEMSLKVIEGEEKGTVYPISKPRFVIGRTNGDLNLNDERISRVHCAIESSAEGVLLRDLESTNGTFLEDERVVSAPLPDGSKFRVGNHLLQLIVVKREIE
jgi:hypothetical protein